jgi:pyruvate ferredoxin oxidoreductase alpha subunit
MSAKAEVVFLSGNEAVAEGARLSRPEVIAAYPITPQTVVVERLAEICESGRLKARYLHVESEHSALSAMIGASAAGARTFTATSSQGLLYMAECLFYAAGGRFPIVMMNANRSLALPWNIYGEQGDSLAMLDSGWIQAYALDVQEALDLSIQAFRIAEDPEVSTPFMINLDGFSLTHSYERVMLPDQASVDAFLPPYSTGNRIDFDEPRSLCFTAGPDSYTAFKLKQHQAMLAAKTVIGRVDQDFERAFGRGYGGLLQTYRMEGARLALISLGGVASTAMAAIDALRAKGLPVGLVRLRYMRPFPADELGAALSGVEEAVVLERAISPGALSPVFTEIAASLARGGPRLRLRNAVGGLGGRELRRSCIEGLLEALLEGKEPAVFHDAIYLDPGVELG